MKKNDIISYLKDKLVDDINYKTESWFLDKEHKLLVHFSCSEELKRADAELLSSSMVDVVIGNGKK